MPPCGPFRTFPGRTAAGRASIYRRLPIAWQTAGGLLASRFSCSHRWGYRVLRRVLRSTTPACGGWVEHSDGGERTGTAVQWYPDWACAGQQIDAAVGTSFPAYPRGARRDSNGILRLLGIVRREGCSARAALQDGGERVTNLCPKELRDRDELRGGYPLP